MKKNKPLGVVLCGIGIGARILPQFLTKISSFYRANFVFTDAKIEIQRRKLFIEEGGNLKKLENAKFPKPEYPDLVEIPDVFKKCNWDHYNFVNRITVHTYLYPNLMFKVSLKEDFDIRGVLSLINLLLKLIGWEAQVVRRQSPNRKSL